MRKGWPAVVATMPPATPAKSWAQTTHAGNDWKEVSRLLKILRSLTDCFFDSNRYCAGWAKNENAPKKHRELVLCCKYMMAPCVVVFLGLRWGLRLNCATSPHIGPL